MAKPLPAGHPDASWSLDIPVHRQTLPVFSSSPQAPAGHLTFVPAFQLSSVPPEKWFTQSHQARVGWRAGTPSPASRSPAFSGLNPLAARAPPSLRSAPSWVQGRFNCRQRLHSAPRCVQGARGPGQPSPLQLSEGFTSGSLGEGKGAGHSVKAGPGGFVSRWQVSPGFANPRQRVAASHSSHCALERALVWGHVAQRAYLVSFDAWFPGHDKLGSNCSLLIEDDIGILSHSPTL